MTMRRRRTLAALPLLLLAGCASLTGMDPVRVQLVGLEPSVSEGLELRLLAKLRVQNPNAQAIVFNGLSVEVTLQGNAVASGVSNISGTLPAYGETVLELPVSLSVAGLGRTLLDFIMGKGSSRIEYALRGKLGTGWGAMRFESRGQVEMPGGLGAQNAQGHVGPV
jgi:LEA14-like dessication related protein